jgi:hypothetical protein
MVLWDAEVLLLLSCCGAVVGAVEVVLSRLCAHKHMAQC